jgi:hypothetical protein
MKLDRLIAYCGLDCAECPGYKATVANDDDLRRKTAEQWSKEFSAPIKPEDINCLGCTPKDGPKIGHCSVCEMRACGVSKGVSTCAACTEYPCAKLEKFFAMVPTARATLDGLRAGA